MIQNQQDRKSDVVDEFSGQTQLNSSFAINWPIELDAWFRGLLLQKFTYPPQVSTTTWNAWVDAVATHGMSALVYSWLQQAAQNHQPPTTIMAELRATYVDYMALAERRRQQLLDLATDFEQAGIYYLVLKGAALAHWLYDSPEFRPSSDIDLIVRPDQHSFARSLLIERGYVTLIGETTPYLHAESFKSPKYKLAVDLHDSISPYAQVIDAIDTQCLFDNALHSGMMKVLNVEASLILASMHQIYTHRQEWHLNWLYDIHLLANEIRDEGVWQNVVASSVDWQARNALSQALLLAHRFFDTQFPAFVNDLNYDSLSSEEVRLNQYVMLYQTQANPKSLWLKTHLFQMKGLSDNHTRLNYIKNRVIPDRHEIDYFYPQLASWPTPLAYFGRLFLVMFSGQKSRKP